jgi:putative redox protein
MTVESTTRVDGLVFDIKSHGFTLRADVSTQLGGTDSAPDPHDYLEISLAACTAITLQMYAMRKNIPLQYADVKVAIKEEGAVNEISRQIKLIGNLTDEHKQQLLIIADKCPMHKFISAGAKIKSEII